MKMLHHLYLFKGLEDSSLERIEAIAELEHFTAGQPIFAYGDPAGSFYIIQHGSVEITLEEDGAEAVEVAKLGTGSHFGEMALLDNEPRSANAVALSDSDIIRIDYDDLKALMADSPEIALHIYREFSRFLCSRLRLTTLDLTFARSQNLSHL